MDPFRVAGQIAREKRVCPRLKDIRSKGTKRLIADTELLSWRHISHLYTEEKRQQ